MLFEPGENQELLHVYQAVLPDISNRQYKEDDQVKENKAYGCPKRNPHVCPKIKPKLQKNYIERKDALSTTSTVYSEIQEKHTPLSQFKRLNVPKQLRFDYNPSPPRELLLSTFTALAQSIH